MVETKQIKKDPVKLYYTKEYYNEFDNIDKTPDFPTLILLEATSHCNMDCLMCLRRVHVQEREKTGLGEGHMSLELIKKIVAECKDEKGLLGLHFAEYGEPLMNPEMVDIVSCIKSAGLKSQIVTNALLLDEKMARRLIEAGLTKVKVSLQGATSEKYEFWRNNKLYNRIEDNILNLVKIRDAMKSDLFIQVGTSSCDDTEEELEAFIKYWKDKVDHVYWNYTALSHIKDDPILKTINILREAPKKTENCKELFLRMTVAWNGQVTQCPRDEENFVGDLNKQTVREVWHSEKMVNNRRLVLEKGNCLPHCDYCVCQPKETLPYNYRYEEK